MQLHNDTLQAHYCILWSRFKLPLNHLTMKQYFIFILTFIHNSKSSLFLRIYQKVKKEAFLIAEFPNMIILYWASIDTRLITGKWTLAIQAKNEL